MYEKFNSLLKKKAKEGSHLSDKEAEAKMDMVDSIDGMMDNDMSDKMKGMKKVTVASDSEEGLKEGLEKAEDVIDEMPSEEEAEELEDQMEEGEEMAEDYEEDMEDSEEEMSIEDRIAAMEEELNKLKMEV